MSSQAPLGEQLYAGQRLGLPEDGPRSVASWGRRVAALFVDWIASSLVAMALFGYQFDATAGEQGWVALAPALVFVVESTVLIPLVGGSFGQALLRIGVVRVQGSPVNFLQAALRSLLILLVIPPLVFNRDNRGLHDLAVGTITLRR